VQGETAVIYDDHISGFFSGLLIDHQTIIAGEALRHIRTCR